MRIFSLRRGRSTALLAALCALVTALALAPGASARPAATPARVAGASATGPWSFSGSGFGHGVGMSQYGALGMAKAGHNHVQILTTYYPGTEVVTRAPSDDLRVLVAERRPTLTFVTGGTTTFGAAGTVPAFKTVTMTRSGNSVRLGGALSATVPALTITFSGDLRIGETGNAYRYGRVAVRPDPAGGLRAVVTNLTMNQYLYGIAEMPASWHTQALRAQAVAARTFAQRRRDSRAGQGLDYDLLATVTDQVYSGTRHEHERWTSAVNVTNAQFLTYKGALAETVYSSSNGGHSESSAYVWGGEVAYLRARRDPYDQIPENPNRAWTRTYTAAQLGAWFGVGTATSVTISGNVGASGRVDRATITVTGTTGRRTMTGVAFRQWINAINPDRSDQLLSTKFVVK